MPSMPGRIRSTCNSPESSRLTRSIWVLSPVITAREFTPNRVRNIFICIPVAFWASSRITNASDKVRPLMYASGAISIVRVSIAFCTRSRGIMSSSASYNGRRYGSTFSCRSPGRNQALPRLHGGARQDDPPHPLARECVHGRRHGKVGLPRSRRPDPDHDVVLCDRVEVLALTGRLGCDHAAQPGQDDLVLAIHLPAERAERFLAPDAVHVVDVQRLSHAREVHERLGHLRRPLHRALRAVERERVPAQGHAHPQPLGELDQVAVVHARERERIYPFGRQPLDGLVAHRSTLMCRAFRSAGPAGAGAPSNSARAAVVLGNAITSRRLPAPVSSMTTRSNPTAKPPWGGAPAWSPCSRNPNRASTSAAASPSSANTFRCTAGSVIRIDPEPSSLRSEEHTSEL